MLGSYEYYCSLAVLCDDLDETVVDERGGAEVGQTVSSIRGRGREAERRGTGRLMRP
jgi:hypothetical protein